MVAVAALPLLAIAASAGLAPHVEKYRDDSRAKAQGSRYRNATQGIDPNNRQALNQGLATAGLISPQEMFGNAMDIGQLGVSRQNAQTAAGRLGLSRDQFGLVLHDRVPTVEGDVNMNAAMGQLINMESGGNPGAVSQKGAAGLGQIMPGNIVPWSREMGLATDEVSDEQILARYANDPQFQGQLASQKFQQYVAQDGLREAYTKWHAGPGTDWADVVRDYNNRGDGSGRYHDGNMHTYDYVMKNMDGYARKANKLDAAASKAEMADAVQTYGTEQQKSLFNNPLATPQTQQAVGQQVLGTAATHQPYDPNADDTLQRNLIQMEQQEAYRIAGEQRAASDAQVVAQEEASAAALEPSVELSGTEVAERFEGLARTERAIDTMSDLKSFVSSRNQNWPSNDKEALKTRVQTTVVPALQKAAEAGVMDQNEFNRQMENLKFDSGWFSSDKRINARLDGVVKSLEEAYQKSANTFEAATTDRQRGDLQYQRRAGFGSGHATPPGDTDGVQ